MAFGIQKSELINWKQQVLAGEIAFLTHYWQDNRFPDCYTVTKVGCADLNKLIHWGNRYALNREWIHHGDYPHFDLLGTRQRVILQKEGLEEHVRRFNL